MPKLPVVSAGQFIKFLANDGFHKHRQRGSHIILRRTGAKRSLVIPNHKELSIGVVTSNLNTAGIAEADFIAAMQKSKKS